jgi:tRNA pseudouridine65 synthase
MKIKILSQTPDYLVVEKPIGLTIHNENTREPSVLTALGGTLYPVHRLDKETSGVLILAKTPEAASVLSEQFQRHQVRKIYTAILRGSVKTEKLLWKWPLSDKAEGRKNPQGLSKDRKDCLTQGQVVAKNDYLSRVEIEIKTGRQHQIRKHAAIAKHPIVGDTRYNDSTYNEKITQRFGVERLFLHASLLEVTWKGKRLTFESPLPADFKKILN